MRTVMFISKPVVGILFVVTYSLAYSQKVEQEGIVDTISFNIKEETREYRFQDQRLLWQTKFSSNLRNAPRVFELLNGKLFIAGILYEPDQPNRIYLTILNEKSGRIERTRELQNQAIKQTDGLYHPIKVKDRKAIEGRPIKLIKTKDQSLILVLDFWPVGAIILKLDKDGKEIWKYEHWNEEVYSDGIYEMNDGSFCFFSNLEDKESTDNELIFNRLSSSGLLVEKQSVLRSTQSSFREGIFSDGNQLWLTAYFTPSYNDKDRKTFLATFHVTKTGEVSTVESFFNDSIKFTGSTEIKLFERLPDNSFRIHEVPDPFVNKTRKVLINEHANLLKDETLIVTDIREYENNVLEGRNKNLGYQIKTDPHFDLEKKDTRYNPVDNTLLIVGNTKIYGIFDKTVVIKLKIK